MPILSRSPAPCCTILAGPGTLPLILGFKSGRPNSIFALNPMACRICSFDFRLAAQKRISRRIGDQVPTNATSDKEQTMSTILNTAASPTDGPQKNPADGPRRDEVLVKVEPKVHLE